MGDCCATSRYPRRSLYGHVRRPRRPGPNMVFVVPVAGSATGLVVGLARTLTKRHPEGVSRVVLLGDPTRALGAVAKAECAIVVAALDLAEELGVPVEWFALSAGARISMDSGTENMD